MKKITVIAGMLLTMMMLPSCHTELSFDADSRPILFSPPLTGASRGESLSSLDGRTFGVRAFVYDTQWESEKSEVLPVSNWVNTPVQCATGGLCSYSPVQDWMHNKNYAFMAYYPLAANSEGTVTLPAANQIRGHIMTYTLHKNAHRDMDKMFDVMYAHNADLNEANTSKVAFTFRHALFGLQLAIANLNNYPEAEPKKYITVQSLSIQLNVKYDKVDIPLDGSPATPYPLQNARRRFEYDYITREVNIPSTLNEGYYDVSQGRHLLFIPQEGLTGTIRIRYDNQREQELPVDFGNTMLRAGVRYIITLQFLGNQINVILINADNWTDVETDVDFE